MASIRDLKKDINYVLGDIIEAVYIWEIASNKPNSEEGDAIINEAVDSFDELITKINDKSVEDRKAHLKAVNKELEAKANSLVEKINKLS
ncbi:hypothetical protein SAMN04487906_2113 [Zhouia amylolytica]|uniref:Uncharacterized protein n=2 Tax=Zhouia amylolytica TaxID=376730 RepID=W2UUC2_9FLAO|nr:hypothetical protein [Zhouia amylolytica]ETN96942.1 hypothetical protein P278_03680 [Zhouia amylolytica AD3]MCQ0110211.1 hypothetical protein [Zhouia amylolytica]SFS92150.1 hypothetical protein SAMN04487906_2113 [Zhouia amylolytica]